MMICTGVIVRGCDVAGSRPHSQAMTLGETKPDARMTDSLLQRIATGDPTAVEGLLDRFGGLVWSLARRLSPTPEDAEDAVQEIFADVWAHADRYDPSVAAERTFVAMIARRRLIDRRRKQSRALPSEAMAEPASLPAPDAGPDLALTEDAERAKELLASLRPEQREALKLSIYDGWSHQRISEKMSLPLGTVKSYIRRGLLQIREVLRRKDAHDPGGLVS